ncbi:xanthine dehydrogenase, molybdenum binding subunit apoprotein [Candidatus Koribacter versatilis Ellin345]|uniref:Xanthine dehydrogenase, molybdenum binding subunit apoprotein n=1 Tax=Koribacter versatilis (strain Ellin345) TaxID=204669 RepID=Q1ITN3_KORVE|nr:xanthine dehydrogenase family protein molybdopterin-binding subunit [Candidatus Koribacter versatilis]ABF39767.1 xanthine dehydrogenase, molybdenum binding subunit apoprotein [Candidatus Koribacter versatilis Ellin345]
MADYQWPDEQHRSLLGKRITRVDGPIKVSGRAKYTYDVRPDGMLWGKILRSPYPHCKVTSIDTSAAEKMPGVKAVQILQKPGSEIHWAGDEIVAIAAVDEPTAYDALKAIKVEYEVLPFHVSDAEPPKNLGVSNEPLTIDELGDMEDNQVPDDEVIAAIQKRGMTEIPDAKTLEALAKDGVPPEIIAAIKKAQVRKGSGVKSPYKKTAVQTQGKPADAFAAAKTDGVVSEGIYGVPVITHCCLESHGAMSQFVDDKNLEVHVSTQNLSGIPAQMSEPMGMPASNIRVLQQYIGGGFGSKFGIDRWGVATAQLAKNTNGKAVKIMLARDEEQQVAGARPSAYARVSVAANKDGRLTAWQSDGWGTGGPGGGGSPPLPYVFDIPNQKKQYTAIATNQGPSRAWRAPNHPQAALITMSALEDTAAKLNMDPLELLRKNIDMTGPRAKTYEEEFVIADQMMGWKERWKPRGSSTGVVRTGMGLSLHTWGGRGHDSNCDLTIQPDGSVEIKMGTQDLGTGTRTCIMIVAADTLGIPLESVNLKIGDTRYPVSGGSGGSTTIGGVSSSTRRAAVDARDQLLAKVAPALGTTPDQIEIKDGTVSVKGDASKSMTWKQACSKLGAVPITVRGVNKGGMKPDLTNSGVGGVQMAEVSVDTETGIVKVTKMVAVQDCGLVVDVKTAETQVYGALIMGISYALYEEKFMDPVTGRMLNPNMEFYRLAGLSDIGELQVHMMTGAGYDDRGVIGLAEPPVVSPGAAISNAVANALGVRVPYLPLTPDRVLAALERS